MPIVASRTDDAVRDKIQSAMLNLVDLSLERLRGDASIIRVCQACDRQVLLDFDGKLRLWEAGLRHVHFSCANPLSCTSRARTTVQRVSKDDVEIMRTRGG